MNSGTGIFAVLIIGLGVFLFYKFLYKKFKHLKCKAITFFTGSVKSGKTAIAISHGLYYYRKALRSWRFKMFFVKLFHLKPIEKPLLYCNCPLSVPYVPLTTKLLLREERFNFKSIVIITEGSILADSQLYKKEDINNRLLLFFKLFGHETHGGKMFIESQSICDMHHAIRRVLTEYIYIHNTTRMLFGTIFSVREQRYSDAGDSINVFDKDIEDDLKRVWVSSRVWRKFDTYALSCHTDYLKNNDNVSTNNKSLKQCKVVSFRDFFNFELDEDKIKNEEVKNEKKDNTTAH